VAGGCLRGRNRLGVLQGACLDRSGFGDAAAAARTGDGHRGAHLAGQVEEKTRNGILSTLRGCKPKPPKIPPTTNFPDFDGWRRLQDRSGSGSGPRPEGTDFPYFHTKYENFKVVQGSWADFSAMRQSSHGWKRLPEFSAICEARRRQRSHI
jgi:hypothetical protein